LNPSQNSRPKARQHGGLAQFLVELPAPKKSNQGAPQTLDFSVNINPYGPSITMLKALKNCDISHYPEPQAESLKWQLAQHYAFSDQQELIVGNGAADLMWSYCQSRVHAASRVLILEPTFSEFRYACQRNSAQIFEFRSQSEQEFAWHYQQITQIIEKQKIEHLYLCHPNSPTGIGVDLDWLTGIAEARPNLTIILDLAFAKLSRYHQDISRALPCNIIKLISLTKDHSIPGVRLGFAIGPASIIQSMERQRPSWSINGFAIAAGKVACREDQFVTLSRQHIEKDQQYLIGQLDSLKIRYHSAAAPMVLIQTGNGRLTQKQLWNRHILVRDCTSYGLCQWIRIFPRPAADVDVLIDCLRHFKKDN